MAQGRAYVVGSRASRLALCQTELVVQSLRASHPDVEFQVRQIRTEGDRRMKAPLSRIGGQGIFVKELETALLAREIDLAVHSLKDVPVELAPGLTLAALPQRGDPRDALVSRDGAKLAALIQGGRIGTGSARRAVQLRALRPDLRSVGIRGNVDTRVRRVDEGEVDAVVLAAAGLDRLGLLGSVAEIFSPDEMVPAVGQGTLAIEAREDDSDLLALVSTVDHRETRLASEAERAFLARLGGGCRLPFAALATVEGDAVRVRGFVSDAEGGRTFGDEVTGVAAEAKSVGVRLAERLLEQGAEELVETA